MKNNPYKDEKGNPTLKRSVVAYIDILGYADFIKEAINNNREIEFLTKLRNALDKAYNNLKQEGKDFPLSSRLYEIKSFSDNIVIGYPVSYRSDDAESELGYIYFLMQDFQMQMVLAGFFVRGAITVGDLYIDKDIVFGNGLIEAYEAGEKLSRDPRIILTQSAADLVKQHISYYYSPEVAPHNRDLLLDADGQLFVNYLESILIAEDEAGPFYDILEEHRKVVQSKLKKFIDQPPKWSKYLWAANYHNAFCDQYSHYFHENYKIDLGEFQMRPTRIV